MREETGFLGRLTLFAVLGLLITLVGCGHETDDPVIKLHPSIEITGGPTEGSTDKYTARIFWSGWDDDGIITHYEYAIDPPLAFTTEEIADPENSPDLTLSLIPGPALYADTLVVSKMDEGKQISFRWIQTREFSRTFAFKTPNADSSFDTGVLEPEDTFSGAHRVYVRCQDNDKLFSEARSIGYTATTITPDSRISRPRIDADILNLGATLTVGWEGIDADSPEANKRPVGFIYRLLRLDTLDPPISILGAKCVHLYEQGPPVIWTYQDADTTAVTLRMSVGGRYVFGVRAVDVAGAIEPFCEQGRNFFKFQAFASGGYPELTISEPALDDYTFTGVGTPVQVQVPTNTTLRFQWNATGEAYGGEIEAYSWGVDIPDLEREGPESGWTPWGDVKISDPVSFARPGIHVFYVRTRDISGSITVGSIILDILEFTFERDLLFVDDSFDNLFPRDSEHDAFWRARFQAAGIDPLFEFACHGDGDRGNTFPVIPTLEEMGRYKLVVWENFGTGYNAVSGLIKAATLTPLLGSYLTAGGGLWVDGRYTVPPMLKSPNESAADLNYPIDDQRIIPGTFLWDFMKVRTTNIRNAKGVDQKDGLWGVAPFPFPPPPNDTTEARVAPYDSMTINPNKLRVGFQFSVPFCDAVWDPISVESDPDFRGDIDSLYVYRAYGPEQQARSSAYHRRLNAIRWHDEDPDFLHGPTQWFGFPMYYMRDNEAQETINRSLEWFREKTQIK